MALNNDLAKRAVQEIPCVEFVDKKEQGPTRRWKSLNVYAPGTDLRTKAYALVGEPGITEVQPVTMTVVLN